MKAKSYDKYKNVLKRKQDEWDKYFEHYKYKYSSMYEYEQRNGERPKEIPMLDFLLDQDCGSDVYEDCSTIVVPFGKDVVKEALKSLYISECGKRHSTEIKFSEDKERIFEEVSEWLTNPRRKDGLMLCGVNGNGKTTMLKAIMNLLNLVFIKEDGDDDICSYMSSYDVKQEAISGNIILIDDVGAEQKAIVEYGATKTPMRDFLLRAYEDRLNLIITTNLNHEAMGRHYEERTADRCKEMFQSVVFNEQSFRGTFGNNDSNIERRFTNRQMPKTSNDKPKKHWQVLPKTKTSNDEPKKHWQV